jgi:hypothetical protein
MRNTEAVVKAKMNASSASFVVDVADLSHSPPWVASGKVGFLGWGAGQNFHAGDPAFPPSPVTRSKSVA